MSAYLEREHFSIARAAEYFTPDGLQKETGQPVGQFFHVILKELIDNALDAAEKVGVAPEVNIEFQSMGGYRMRLAIHDNGHGIPPAVVEKLLDFAYRTSDKAAYRAPLRGAQGNALKTVLGIPVALGDPRGRLTIEAASVRHDIEIWITPAGEVKHIHTQTPAVTTGTRIEITIPPYKYGGMNWASVRWLYAFALFNPHARLQIRELPPPFELAKSDAADLTDLSFDPTVDFPGAWRKFLPTDTTPAHWYTGAEFATLVHLKAAVHPDQPIGEFIQEFRNLSRKWRQVRQAVSVETVGQLAEAPASIPALHQAMRAAATAPSPEILGRVGPDHFQYRFDEAFTVKPSRFWYRHTFGEADGMPFLVEVAIAQTEEAGEIYYGLNFSVPFSDPLADTLLRVDGGRFAYGIASFLHGLGAVNNPDPDYPLHVAAAVHLVMPLLPALDRGKSRLAISRDLADRIAETLAKTAKTLDAEFAKWRGERHAGRKAAVKAAEDQERAIRATLPSKREAVFSLIPDTYQAATENETLYLAGRDYYYVVRPPFTAMEVRPSTKRNGDESTGLDYGYFSQRILIDYRRDVHPLTMIDYKARGIIYDPHTGEEMPIGDKELRDWTFPLWQYNKLLFIEKEGIWNNLKQVGGIEFAKKYDMAIICSEGYSTEAVRKLMASAQKDEGYQLFVWHDADPYGYNIARTLAEETQRMPGHAIQVYDLGLRLESAINAGYQSETFTRRNALPSTVSFTPYELEKFTGRKVEIQKGKVEFQGCIRVEINAIPIRQRIPYLEAQLAAIENLLPKVKPPNSLLKRCAEEELRKILKEKVRDEVESRLNLDALVDEALKRIGTPFTFNEEGLSRSIDERFESKPERSWRAALKEHIDGKLDSTKVDIKGAVTAALTDPRMETATPARETAQ